ncbi:MAG TPA: hypothetical protein VFC63_05560 [Blastocatellia bacterium]|nr:hypothetical protein [Blastocatellia bacterium]
MATGTLWQLVKLRYKLIWAQARSSNGRAIFILIACCLFIGAVIVSLLLGILGGAAIGALGARAGQIVRGMLAVLFGLGIMTGVLLGVGPRPAFADSVLRRYPLNSRQRFISRHLTGLLDPAWPLLAAVAIGLVISLSFAGVTPIYVAFPAVVIMIIAAYLLVATIFTFMDILLRKRGGAAIVGILLILPISFSGVILPWLLNSHHPGRYAAFDKFLKVTPPGTAAAAMLDNDPVNILLNLFILIAWCGILSCFLGLMEMREANISTSSAAVKANFSSPYDRIASLFGPKYAQFAGKSLRYYLRSNQIRLSFVTFLMVVFMGPLMGRGPAGGFFMTMALFTFVGFSSSSAITSNQFGYDGPGIRRYVLLPVSFGTALRAGSFVALFVGFLAIFPALVLFTILFARPFDMRQPLILLLSAISGLFFFNGLALLTSVYAPWPASLQKVVGNKPPLITQLLLMVPMITAISFGPSIGFFVKVSVLLDNWWAMFVPVLIGFAVYFISLKLMTTALEKRREKIVQTIAGGINN